MNIHVIITSIANDQNIILKDIAKGCQTNNFNLIIVGDKKSPENFFIEGVKFISVEIQKKLRFDLIKKLPYNHYSRKNLGYLLAMRNEADVIIDTDDDNIPLQGFWKVNDDLIKCRVVNATRWVNVYRYFSNEFIWPRGFPVELLKSEEPGEYENISEEVVKCPIQQGLADENPDVDAIYRLIGKLPINFDTGKSVALSNGSWCPFNSQNTVWHKDAFPLLYLPSYCSFRMTDIWRSYVAQVIAYNYNWGILFYSPTVYQERNPHNLLQDFKDEVPGYLNNYKIVQELSGLNLKGQVSGIYDNLLILYRKLIELKVVGEEELRLLESWINDLNYLNSR